MTSPILPHRIATGFPIALLVCIVVAVTIFVVLMVIAFHYYLLRRRRRRPGRRHHELRDRTPRSAIYIAPMNSKVKPPTQPQKRPLPALHTRTLTPPMLPQIRLQSPFAPSRPFPSITARLPIHSVVPQQPPRVRLNLSTRAPNHVAVPISSFSEPKDRSTRAPLHRVDSDLASTQYDDNNNQDDGGGRERERREVVNEFFAAAVGKRDRESDVQMGRWRTSTRERAILASDASGISVVVANGDMLLDETTTTTTTGTTRSAWGNSTTDVLTANHPHHPPWARNEDDDTRWGASSNNSSSSKEAGGSSREEVRMSSSRGTSKAPVSANSHSERGPGRHGLLIPPAPPFAVGTSRIGENIF